MKRYQALLAIALSLIVILPSIASATLSKHADKPDLGPIRLEEDKELKTLVSSFGGRYFYPPGHEAEFKKDYEETKFDGKTLVDAINEVKPRRNDNDEIASTTAAEELPLARAIADMMPTLTTKGWSQGWDEVNSIVKKMNKNGSTDTQAETFFRRLMVAFNNWGTDKNTNEKIENEPKDKSLIPFYKAWIVARDEAEKKIAEFQKKIDLAANGSEAAKKELWGDKNDKDPNSSKNQFAVGKNVNAYINQLIDQGEGDRAFKMMKALSKWENNHYNYSVNDSDGKPRNFTFEKDNQAAALKGFKDDKMVASTFVGHPHDPKSGVKDWAWDKTKQALALVEPAPAAPSTGGAQGAAAGTALAKSADAGGGSGGDVASAGSVSGAQAFKDKCLFCHNAGSNISPARKGTPVGQKAIDAIEQGRMPQNGSLTADERAAIISYLGGQVASR